MDERTEREREVETWSPSSPSSSVSSGSSARRRYDTAQIVKAVAITLLVAVLVIVALDNRRDVRLGYAVGDASAPVWIVVVAAAAAGVVIGWLIRHRPHRH